jgi:hypothetical protein
MNPADKYHPEMSQSKADKIDQAKANLPLRSLVIIQPFFEVNK